MLSLYNAPWLIRDPGEPPDLWGLLLHDDSQRRKNLPVDLRDEPLLLFNPK